MRKQQIDETFALEPEQVLVQHVTLDDETTYAHRCPLESFKQIAHTIEDAGEAGTTIMKIAEAEDLPSSQVAVARAFLLERGVVEKGARRRIRAVGEAMFEDAMIDFFALGK